MAAQRSVFSIGEQMRDIQRYVGMVYFAGFAVGAWLFPRILLEIFDAIGPGVDRPVAAGIRLSTVVGLLIAGALIAWLWKNEAIHEWTTEVVEQLAKVTWPDADETRRSTTIVIGFSIVLGCLLALMDLAGKRVIDLIFQVFS